MRVTIFGLLGGGLSAEKFWRSGIHPNEGSHRGRSLREGGCIHWFRREKGNAEGRKGRKGYGRSSKGVVDGEEKDKGKEVVGRMAVLGREADPCQPSHHEHQPLQPHPLPQPKGLPAPVLEYPLEHLQHLHHHKHLKEDLPFRHLIHLGFRKKKKKNKKKKEKEKENERNKRKKERKKKKKKEEKLKESGTKRKNKRRERDENAQCINFFFCTVPEMSRGFLMSKNGGEKKEAIYSLYL